MNPYSKHSALGQMNRFQRWWYFNGDEMKSVAIHAIVSTTALIGLIVVITTTSYLTIQFLTGG